MTNKRKVTAGTVAILACLAVGAAGQTLEIHHIDIGQGDATLIIGPGGVTILIDGGQNSRGDDVIVPYLQGLKIGKLDYMIATHMDADHIGGLDEVLASGIRVERVLDNGSTSTSNSYQDYLNAARKHAGSRSAIQPGFEINLGQGATALCIYSNGETANGGMQVTNENDKSVCLLIEFDNFQYFIGGDLGGGGTGHKDVEGFIAPAVGDVDVLRINHHGSASSTSAYFVKTLSPEAAIISVGKNGYGHPTAKVLSRLRARNIDALQTGAGRNPSGKVMGNIKIVVKKGRKYWINSTLRKKDEFIKSKNSPPVASFTHSVNNRTVSYDGSGSRDEVRIRHYFWNFGDGSTVSGKRKAKVSHTYQSEGNYTVLLSVLDKFGIAAMTKKTFFVGVKKSFDVTAYAEPSNPKRYSHVKIHVTVKDQAGSPVSGASITTVANYKTTKTTKYGTTGSAGTSVIDYNIGAATAGYTVRVDVSARYGGKTATTTTSFTPTKEATQQISVSAYASPSTPKRYTHVKIYVTVTNQSGNPVSGASITTVANYKTTRTTKYGTTGSAGTSVIDYYISSATAGFTVRVDVTARSGGMTAYTTTSFTPHN